MKLIETICVAALATSVAIPAFAENPLISGAFSVDGRVMTDFPIKELKNARFMSVENPFHQPHYLLMNLALGGECGGDVTAIKYPVHMYVDYVRVYQKKK